MTAAAVTQAALLRRGALALVAAATVWLGAANGAAAQVRFHGEAGGNYSVAVLSWRDIPFRTVVRQQYDYSCGSAALATLLHFHYGRAIGESEVFQAMYAVGDQERIQQVGFSMLDMKTYLEQSGFQADGLRLTLAQLAALNIPTVALITRQNYRHFVVVKGIRDDAVLIGDPTFGLQTYTRAEFETMWNGVVLAVRHAPADADAPAFNRDEEWRPWAVAPLGAAGGPVSPSDLLREAPELYQISPVRQD